MIFESSEFYMGTVEPKDLNAVLAVYESNVDFLMHHTGHRHVTGTWLQNELETMEAAGFCSYKVVEKSTGNVIGIVDFQTGDETYLSLLMLHGNYQNKGLGISGHRKLCTIPQQCTHQNRRCNGL